ncbi:MAG: T9SS type A sorting domain-containing protein, partial [Flavobacteriales bacterium]
NGCNGTVIVSIIFNGIDDLDPLAFGLFPNPTTGAITLQVSTLMQDVNMQVLDATGRVVFTQDALVLQGATTFDFSNLSTGTYTIVIRNDNGTSVRRLSIQN